MNVRAFDLDAYPRVPARKAHAVRAALRACATLPATWSVPVPPLGTAKVTFAGFATDERQRSGGIDLAVSFGVSSGCLRVESELASRLVDAVLRGALGFSEVRVAGPAERGVLAGVLAPLFDSVGGSVHLGPRPSRTPESAAILFRLETVIATGWLRLTVPPGWPAHADRDDVWQRRADRIPVTGHVEIAVTSVPAAALARADVGDAIVFDGVASATLGMNALRSGRLRIGSHAADVTIDATGQLSITGGFLPLQQEERMSAAGSNTDTTTVLGAATIEVVAEIGRISLRGDEVLGLAPGAVLAVGKGRPAVSLRVGGEIWAEGEIVDIDGELGVRVTRIANR